jgi:4-amino-4-deoxy-L-arabinose transferase-like glycosyltransferase
MRGRRRERRDNPRVPIASARHPRLTRRRAALALVALALLARAVFVLATPAYAPRGDDLDYFRLGAAIAQTGTYPVAHVWVTDRGCPPVRSLPRTPCLARPHAPGARRVARPIAYRPPAYPYALALPHLLAGWVGADHLAFARALQALIGVLDVGLVGLLARLLWGERVALLALGIAAVYLPLVLVSGTLISEPLYVACMLGAVCAVLARRRRGGVGLLVLAGGLAGLAALTRTNGLLVVGAVVALAAARSGRSWRRGIAAASLVLVAAALALTPWLVRDEVVFGHFVAISTESGGTLLGTYNATAASNRKEPAAWIGLSHTAGYAGTYREQGAHPGPTVDAALRHDALTYIGNHPGYLWTVFWHNTVRLFDLDGFARVRFGARTVGLPPGPAVAGAIMFWLVALLAVAGVIAGRARQVPWAVGLLVALQFLSTVFVNTETPRFRTPLEPFVVLAAACALERLGAAARWLRAPRRVQGAAVPSA